MLSITLFLFVSQHQGFDYIQWCFYCKAVINNKKQEFKLIT